MFLSPTSTLSAPEQSRGVPFVEPESVPLVTVIMPVRNEEQFLPRCLDSLLANDYPHERLEMLIADGMSTDRSREILAAYSQRFPFVRVLDNPARTAPTGLNVAIRQAQGDLIVRVDAHTVFAPDYIRQCVHLLQTTTPLV